MTAQVGDIVALGSGLKYVVQGFIGNPTGSRDAKLIRRNADGSFTGFQKGADALIPIETPTFESGEHVTVDGLPGAFMSYDGDDVRVMLAQRSRPLRNGGSIEIEAAVCRVPRAKLVLENRRV